MQVFKTYMKIVKKNLSMALMYTGIFIVLIILFSGNTMTDQTFENARLGVCVIDEDNTDASRYLKEFIGKKHTLVDVENDKDEILDALYYTRADYVLKIKEGFEEKMSIGDTEGLFTNYKIPDSYYSVVVDNAVNEYVSVLGAYIAGGDDINTASAKTAESLLKEINIRVETFSDNKESSDFPVRTQFFFNYLPYVIISALISVLSTVLIKMNNKELFYRARCSSTTSMSHTIQILLGSMTLVLTFWVIFMVVGMVMNGGIYTGKALYAVLNSFVLLLVSAGIAILIAIIAKEHRSMAMIANIISLGMSFLCGVFVEQALLGDEVLNISRFLPVYWYVKANDLLRNSAEAAFDTNEFMTCIGIEALFAAALFAVILLVSKTKHNAK